MENNTSENYIENNKTTAEIEDEYLNNKKNSVIYQDDSTIELLKEEYKITGENELYEVETENDGRKVLNIKPSINYKVAFAGMIKGTNPDLQEIDTIFEKEHPKKSGIWVNKSSRDKILNYLNSNRELDAGYEIDEDGYLSQTKEKGLKGKDKIIRELINGDKQYILDISSTCFMVDPVTGKIIENRYNDLDSYQTYEYFEDEKCMILFISENVEGKIEENEIFNSIIRLFEN
ncbi:MAG: hypothetical protein J5881_03495 [Clostridia bacterium]|nr:hypothetical protein [Clostridia bacterium]